MSAYYKPPPGQPKTSPQVQPIASPLSAHHEPLLQPNALKIYAFILE